MRTELEFVEGMQLTTDTFHRTSRPIQTAWKLFSKIHSF
jgi:hypothetical protein